MRRNIVPKTAHTTREGWLMDVAALLDEEFFKGRGYDMPKSWRVSCGFPKSTNGRAIGQCWDKTASADETYEMFICPTLGEAIEVAATLLHEMIHAAVGIEEGHKGMFRKLAKEFGLAGKMTATYAEEGSDLHKQLEVFCGRVGKYPHAAMSKKRKPAKPNPWVRYVSINEETFKVVVNEKRVEEFGAPRDPWGDEMEPVNG